MSEPCLSWDLFVELMDTHRFSLKLRQIVLDEAGDNFITKLHRGKLDIMPWPVIQSAQFYRMIGSLKTRLEKRPVNHKSAGDFLRVFKMLMAKLKVCTHSALSIDVLTEILFQAYDCYTTYKCPHACEFGDQHDGLPAPICDVP